MPHFKKTQLLQGDWQCLGEHALALRREVFVQEQGVAPELENDAWDTQSQHAVVLNCLGMPVATGRLLPSKDGVSRIGRMAVKRVLRGGGLGKIVLQALLDKAYRRGDRVVELHAQISAKDFYGKFGFKAEGAMFEEAGIAHITMRKQLA